MLSVDDKAWRRHSTLGASGAPGSSTVAVATGPRRSLTLPFAVEAVAVPRFSALCISGHDIPHARAIRGLNYLVIRICPDALDGDGGATIFNL